MFNWRRSNHFIWCRRRKHSNLNSQTYCEDSLTRWVNLNLRLSRYTDSVVPTTQVTETIIRPDMSLILKRLCCGMVDCSCSPKQDQLEDAEYIQWLVEDLTMSPNRKRRAPTYAHPTSVLQSCLVEIWPPFNRQFGHEEQEAVGSGGEHDIPRWLSSNMKDNH